jgi:hypothetical protein
MKKVLVMSIALSILFVVLSINLSAQSNDDKNACEYARKDSNVETWKFYLENFPNGECADEAKAALEGANSAKDQIACKKAKQQNSYQGWKEYLENFPHGKCAFEAKIALNKLNPIPECSRTSQKPCKDSSTGLMWSYLSYGTFNEATNYCHNLQTGIFNDWRLPNINELRTLIQGCYQTETGGECYIDLGCTKIDEDNRNSCTNGRCTGCSAYKKDGYGKLFISSNDGHDTYWSSSNRVYTNVFWGIHFPNASVDWFRSTEQLRFVCVRGKQK